METVIGNSPEIIAQAQCIRRLVFVEEQQIPKALDLDGFDEASFHILVQDGDESVATARLLPITHVHAVMARVAVLMEYRGQGLATIVVKALLQCARDKGLSSVEIHAHEYLRQYYESLGFEFIRNVEIVGKHQLIEMNCRITL